VSIPFGFAGARLTAYTAPSARTAKSVSIVLANPSVLAFVFRWLVGHGFRPLPPSFTASPQVQKLLRLTAKSNARKVKIMRAWEKAAYLPTGHGSCESRP